MHRRKSDHFASLTRRQCLVTLGGGALAALLLPDARARSASWPTRPVTIIVPYAAGGFTDVLARLSAQYLSEKLGQTFLIENRPGAGGAIGARIVAAAQPDGYTLLFGSASQFGIAPLIQKINYDPDALAPIAIFGKIPFLLAINAAFPANDLSGFIKAAKALGRPVNASNTGYGSTSYLLVAAFAHQAGFNVTPVPYKGSAPSAAAVMQGDVDMTWAGVSDVAPIMASNKIKIIAVSSQERLPTYPDVPSVGEALPGFSLETWNGYFGPPGTPSPIIDLVAKTVQEAVASPDVHRRLVDLGITPVTASPQQTAATIRSDKAFYRKIVDAAGIKPQ
jgi:tripartite-type tricarboxylate transporter receptor subunit TctC